MSEAVNLVSIFKLGGKARGELIFWIAWIWLLLVKRLGHRRNGKRRSLKPRKSLEK